LSERKNLYYYQLIVLNESGPYECRAEGEGRRESGGREVRFGHSSTPRNDFTGKRKKGGYITMVRRIRCSAVRKKLLLIDRRRRKKVAQGGGRGVGGYGRKPQDLAERLPRLSRWPGFKSAIGIDRGHSMRIIHDQGGFGERAPGKDR